MGHACMQPLAQAKGWRRLIDCQQDRTLQAQAPGPPALPARWRKPTSAMEASTAGGHAHRQVVPPAIARGT
jgi:hypothetical protein